MNNTVCATIREDIEAVARLVQKAFFDIRRSLHNEAQKEAIDSLPFYNGRSLMF